MKRQNRFTRIATLVMALAMVLAISATAFADNGSNTIVISNTTSGYTYAAYQVFDGTYTSDNTMAVTGWGNGVNSTALLAALAANTELGLGVTAADTASQVADKIDAKNLNDANAAKLASIIGQHVTNESGSFAFVAGTGYRNTTVGDGYYLVKNLTAPDNASLSRFLLKVSGDATVTIAPKPVTPTIDKVIDEGAGVDVAEASIGDYVPYKITSKVPDMTGYTKYYFIVTDALSEGLTFVNNTEHPLEIKVGSKTLVKDTDYTLTVDTALNTIKIVFKTFIQYQTSQPSADITIKYYAMLNEKAVVPGPNENSVKLEYSRNPNIVPGGVDEPGTGDNVTGETPAAITSTYTAQLTVQKTDALTGLPLKDATFELKGTGVNTPVVSTATTFTESTTVTGADAYYRLKAGTYTNTAPTPATEGQYESTTIKYAKTTTTTVKQHTNSGANSAVTGTSLGDGTITFKGLGAGTYTLTETDAPDGFEAADPIIFKLSFSGTTPATAEFAVDNTKISLNGANSALATVTIANGVNSTLPTTGGVGTTLFYVFGSLLVIGAGVLLVTRKRMEKNDK